VTTARVSDEHRAAQHRRRLRDESDYHQARLLLLLTGFTDEGESFAGLTRLVKLDFLLRYPVMTRRLLPAGVDWPEEAKPTADELLAVESRMIRYRYGPWDDRYYPMLGALVGRGFAVFTGGRKFAAQVTPVGRTLAGNVAAQDGWQRTAMRVRVLREHLDLSGQQLKELIYEHLDDVAALPQRTEI
jgi:hypothetical protein